MVSPGELFGFKPHPAYKQPGYSEQREVDFRQIGEYDVETKVGFIDMLGHDPLQVTLIRPTLGPHAVLVTLTILLLSSCHGGTRTSSSNMNNQPNPGLTLIGRWRQVGPTADESTSMVFTNDGKLIYSIHNGNGTQVINMVYEVSGDEIITDQPSSPRKEISKFYFEPSGILVIDYEGDKARFTREP